VDSPLARGDYDGHFLAFLLLEWATDSVRKPYLDCHSESFAVILSPSLVILSGAKNLALPLGVNSAKSLS